MNFEGPGLTDSEGQQHGSNLQRLVRIRRVCEGPCTRITYAVVEAK